MRVPEWNKIRCVRWFLSALFITLILNIFSPNNYMDETISDYLVTSMKESNLLNNSTKNQKSESVSLDTQNDEDEEYEDVLAMFTEDYFDTKIIDDDSNNDYNTGQSLQNGDIEEVNQLDINLEDDEILENSVYNIIIKDEIDKEGVFEVNEDLWDIDKVIAKLNLKKEKRVAAVAKKLWVNWKQEKSDYAKLAWIEWEYRWTLEQNEKIRNYLINNAAEIYKENFGWNDWDRLALTEGYVYENVKLNSEPITWQITYNNVTLNVSAPEWSFPEWTVLRIKSLGDEDSTTTFDITLKEIQLMTQIDKVEYDAPMASFDISFYAPDDVEYFNELQPVEWKSVSVVFDYWGNSEFNNPEDNWFLAIYHMVESDETSIANLVWVKNTEETNYNTKSDSIGIYANELSVYILTVVSDLEDNDSNQTITFDVGSGEIITNDNILISSSCTGNNCICTWKILSNNDSISLPDVNYTWYNFWWWYSGSKFLWYPGNLLYIWNSENSTWENLEDNNYEIYACLYTEWSGWNICSINENVWVLKGTSEINNSESITTENDENSNTKYDISEEYIQKYGQEMCNAYDWAINNGITTIDDLSKAKLNKKITRAELAKMMVEFMSWVLEKEPIITGEVVYNDVDSQKLWDLSWYIQLAYQYQIMWINADWSPIESFDPDKNITRAEFATVLSRVLFWSTYNQSWTNYYEKHIEALEQANILSNTNPNLVEARWWIMVMLHKSQNVIDG